MEAGSNAYSLWPLVFINAGIFIIFALSFIRPRTKRDWRTFGAFAAFVIALFTEMYGFPLTVYLLSGWLASRHPGVDLLSHNSGHLWQTVFGLGGDPHADPLHVLSNLVIGAGLLLLVLAWRVLYRAQRGGHIATSGPYLLVRHPQYLGLFFIMMGFLLQWPTLITLAMFPILLVMYGRLAKREEEEARAQFGAAYEQYALKTPAFLPRIRRRQSRSRADEPAQHLAALKR